MREAWRRGRKADGTPSDILRGGVHVNMECCFSKEITFLV